MMRKIVRSPSPPLEAPPDRIIISNSDWIVMQKRVQSCVKDGIRAIKETYVNGAVKHSPITVYPTCMIALQDLVPPTEIYQKPQIETLEDEKFSQEWKTAPMFR